MNRKTGLINIQITGSENNITVIVGAARAETDRAGF